MRAHRRSIASWGSSASIQLRTKRAATTPLGNPRWPAPFACGSQRPRSAWRRESLRRGNHAPGCYGFREVAGFWPPSASQLCSAERSAGAVCDLRAAGARSAGGEPIFDLPGKRRGGACRQPVIKRGLSLGAVIALARYSLVPARGQRERQEPAAASASWASWFRGCSFAGLWAWISGREKMTHPTLSQIGFSRRCASER